MNLVNSSVVILFALCVRSKAVGARRVGAGGGGADRIKSRVGAGGGVRAEINLRATPRPLDLTRSKIAPADHLEVRARFRSIPTRRMLSFTHECQLIRFVTFGSPVQDPFVLGNVSLGLKATNLRQKPLAYERMEEENGIE